MPKNPAIYATVPKYKSAKREIWTAETLMHALEVCEDERLKLALNLAFLFYAYGRNARTHLGLR